MESAFRWPNRGRDALGPGGCPLAGAECGNRAGLLGSRASRTFGSRPRRREAPFPTRWTSRRQSACSLPVSAPASWARSFRGTNGGSPAAGWLFLRPKRRAVLGRAEGSHAENQLPPLCSWRTWVGWPTLSTRSTARWSVPALALLLAVGLGGCANLGYYAQAVGGHWRGAAGIAAGRCAAGGPGHPGAAKGPDCGGLGRFFGSPSRSWAWTPAPATGASPTLSAAMCCGMSSPRRPSRWTPAGGCPSVRRLHALSGLLLARLPRSAPRSVWQARAWKPTSAGGRGLLHARLVR